MDMQRFEALARWLAITPTRRAAILALGTLLTPIGWDTLDAKRRKKRRKKKKRKPSCPGGQKQCNGRCIAQDDCCADIDCGETVCDNGVCVCPAGTRFCQSTESCIPADDCCGCASNQRCCQVDGEPRCVVLGSDPDHCGACNRPCGQIEVCINGGCAQICEEDADCAPDTCFDRVGFNQRVCAFTASLPQFCDSVETCAGGGDAACAGDIKEACLEDICGLAQGCGRIAV